MDTTFASTAHVWHVSPVKVGRRGESGTCVRRHQHVAAVSRGDDGYVA